MSSAPAGAWASGGYAGAKATQRFIAGYAQQLGELLIPELAGSAMVGLVRADPATIVPGYLLTAAELRELGGR